MIVDAVNESGDVAALVGTNHEALRRILCRQESHHAIAIVVLSILQVINVAYILGYDGKVLDESICFDRKPAHAIHQFIKIIILLSGME